MPQDYVHNHKDFADLLDIVGRDMGILPGLVEKDYWIMQVLYGLKKQGFAFRLKGGTSLSKGYKIIDRFSEDIDIYITPPPELNVDEDPSKVGKKSVESRKGFYDWLAKEIEIDSIVSIERDTAFDNKIFTSGGIRLLYKSKKDRIEGVKPGILLEAGFDRVTPSASLTIGSWALERALTTLGDKIIDNTAVDIDCYHPGYTFVEKLQTIATKFRQEQSEQKERPNYMRQYYDVACLLGRDEVQQFIGTEEYEQHKKLRFPKKDLEIPVAQNEAFLLSDQELRGKFKTRYSATANLYYRGQRPFDELLEIIHANLNRL